MDVNVKVSKSGSRVFCKVHGLEIDSKESNRPKRALTKPNALIGVTIPNSSGLSSRAMVSLHAAFDGKRQAHSLAKLLYWVFDASPNFSQVPQNRLCAFARE